MSEGNSTGSQAQVPVNMESDINTGSDFVHDINTTESDFVPVECQEHSSEKVQMYCNKCDVMVCTKCVMENHNGHKFSPLDKAASRKKLILKKHMVNLSGKDCAELQEKLQRVREFRKEARARTSSAREGLERAGREMKEKVDLIVKRMARKLDSQLQGNEEILAKTERDLVERLTRHTNLSDQCQAGFNSNNPVEILTQEKDVKRTLQVVANESDISVPQLQVLDYIPGSLSETSVKDQIGHLEEENISNTDFTFL